VDGLRPSSTPLDTPRLTPMIASDATRCHVTSCDVAWPW
jgi:hypothetical protein